MAIQHIEMSIQLHDHYEEDKYKPKSVTDLEKEGLMSLSAQAQNFNRLQYQNFLTSSLFM